MDHAPAQKARLIAFARQLARYGFTTGASLAFLYGALHLTDTLGIPGSWAYPVLLLLVYAGVYLSYAHYVFRTEANRETLIRFGLVLAGSWIANSLLFRFTTATLHAPYALALLINTFVLGWIRFFLQRQFVFKPRPSDPAAHHRP